MKTPFFCFTGSVFGLCLKHEFSNLELMVVVVAFLQFVIVMMFG